MSHIYRMKLEDIPLQVTRMGKKTIEVRLWDERRRSIRPGDVIEFESLDGRETLQRRVSAIRKYKTIQDLTSAEDFQKTGGIYKDRSEWIDKINSYYSSDKQAQFGLIALEIEPVE